ncbi:MAG: alkaline phosphatase, partial [Alistipes sp.]|nr:alkaline phosphatase [Alistipes sp.]
MKKFTLCSLAGIILFSFLFLTRCGCGENQVAEPQVMKVIYMIGDGMGLAQVTAYMLENDYRPINMDRAQAVGLVKTYSANNRVTDSAAAGTALAAGSKTNNSMLGINPEGNQLISIMARAQQEGLGSGIVINSYLTDATPGAFYAHVNYRGEHETIAAQLAASGVDVFMGGGRNSFDRREDGRNLPEELAAEGYAVAFRFDELDGVTEGKTAGFFSPGYMPYVLDGRQEDYLPLATEKTLE